MDVNLSHHYSSSFCADERVALEAVVEVSDDPLDIFFNFVSSAHAKFRLEDALQIRKARFVFVSVPFSLDLHIVHISSHLLSLRLNHG